MKKCTPRERSPATARSISLRNSDVKVDGGITSNRGPFCSVLSETFEIPNYDFSILPDPGRYWFSMR